MSDQRGAAAQVISRYYEAFNQGRWQEMLDLLDDQIEHEVNQGTRHVGKEHFTSFLHHMERCYREQLEEIIVLTDASGERAAAEFIVSGTYLSTDSGLPAATGQSYRLPAGAFFTLRDGLITRVSTYYNLQLWLEQISATP